ncbi:cytochrome c biogenesis protein [Asanoa siamensis]|uniref:Cytochrome c biogenesis protein n=1 Tax=Asanoa siamensis TaxID=926357 RepID=A0ABQ4D0K7_9ACTN|nr:cytochrome c biogenesis protein [Asanoa siamensis]
MVGAPGDNPARLAHVERLKVEVLVPDTHVEAVLAALHAAGAGAIGSYDHCVSSWRVDGRWRPLPGSSPYLGQIGAVMHGSETKIESICDVDQVRGVVDAVRAVHPYEEPVIHLLPLYDLA